MINDNKREDDIMEQQQQDSVITVIDGCPGSGKTSLAIQRMNKREAHQRYIYITPFKQEVDRICEACKGFVQPKVAKSHKTKAEHLYELIQRGENIAMTHELFKHIERRHVDALKEFDFHCILDEVLDCIEVEEIERGDIGPMFEDNILKAGDAIDSDGKIVKVKLGDNNTGWSRYDDIREKARLDRLVLLRPHRINQDNEYAGTLLLWLFPKDAFKAMKSVTIMTYMFEGSIMRGFLEMNELPYVFKSVHKDPSTGKYTECEYDYETHDIKFRDLANRLLNVYEGIYNAVGDGHSCLSKNWFKNISIKSGYAGRKLLKISMFKFFRSVKGNARDNLWTTFKDFEKYLRDPNSKFCSTKNFLAHNTRARNDFRQKKHLCYSLNKFMNPDIARYFRDAGIDVSEEQYALLEMLQWLYRGRIRMGRKMNVFIPSRRMRFLLKDWLEGEFSAQIQEAA
jgi:hypothetical protein